jgi:hypothetical protein
MVSTGTTAEPQALRRLAVALAQRGAPSELLELVTGLIVAQRNELGHAVEPPVRGDFIPGGIRGQLLTAPPSSSSSSAGGAHARHFLNGSHTMRQLRIPKFLERRLNMIRMEQLNQQQQNEQQQQQENGVPVGAESAGAGTGAGAGGDAA